MYVLPLVTCCLLYLLRTRLIKEFCSFSHSSCSCGVPLLQFQKTHFLQEEAKERKEVTFPLVEIILSAQSFTLLLKSFIATAVVMQAFFCICICICCTDDKKKVPLAAAAAMQGVFVGRGRAGVGKKIAPVLPAWARGKRQENTGAPKFNPDQCKKVSPLNLDKKLFKTSKK